MEHCGKQLCVAYNFFFLPQLVFNIVPSSANVSQLLSCSHPQANADTLERKRPTNNTFDGDDLSCDSTSDSGRGGSDVDAKEKGNSFKLSFFYWESILPL